MFIDGIYMEMAKNRTAEGFKNTSLVLAEYTDNEENKIAIFFIADIMQTLVTSVDGEVSIENGEVKKGNICESKLKERLFTSINNPEIWACKNALGQDKEVVSRGDIDSDNNYLVSPTTKILNYVALNEVLKRMGYENVEVITPELEQAIIAYAKEHNDEFGFGTFGKSR